MQYRPAFGAAGLLLLFSSGAFCQFCTQTAPTILSTLTGVGSCGATTWLESYNYTDVNNNPQTQDNASFSPLGTCYGYFYDCAFHWQSLSTYQGCIGAVHTDGESYADCSAGQGNVIPYGSPVSSYELTWDSVEWNSPPPSTGCSPSDCDPSGTNQATPSFYITYQVGDASIPHC